MVGTQHSLTVAGGLRRLAALWAAESLDSGEVEVLIGM